MQSSKGSVVLADEAARRQIEDLLVQIQERDYEISACTCDRYPSMGKSGAESSSTDCFMACVSTSQTCFSPF